MLIKTEKLPSTDFQRTKINYVYRTVWTSVLLETLYTIHESDNVLDRHAIAARKRLSGSATVSTVGHLPKEISRITRYITSYGAIVTVKVVDRHHRRSLLVQGGLEIPIAVSVAMKYSEQNEAAMLKHDQLLNKHYKKPDQYGKFERVNKKILKELNADSDTDEEEETEVC